MSRVIYILLLIYLSYINLIAGSDNVQNPNEFDAKYCSPDAVYQNTTEGYLCTCKEGYTGNGDTCYAVATCLETGADGKCIHEDKCSNSVCKELHQTCKNTNDSYKCICEDGFKEHIQGVCEDINECLSSPCGDNEECINNDGSFRCTCRVGFVEKFGQCEDVNECNTQCYNKTRGVCINTPGSYNCTCKAGWENKYSYGLCEDVDECQINDFCGDGGGSDSCHNHIGGFECKCNNGYEMNIEDHKCIQSKSCGENSFYKDDKCECKDGYKLAGNGSCIPETACDTKVCGPGAECHNNNEYGYQCICKQDLVANDYVPCKELLLCDHTNYGDSAVCTPARNGRNQCQYYNRPTMKFINATQCEEIAEESEQRRGKLYDEGPHINTALYRIGNKLIHDTKTLLTLSQTFRITITTTNVSFPSEFRITCYDSDNASEIFVDKMLSINAHKQYAITVGKALNATPEVWKCDLRGKTFAPVTFRFKAHYSSQKASYISPTDDGCAISIYV